MDICHFAALISAVSYARNIGLFAVSLGRQSGKEWRNKNIFVAGEISQWLELRRRIEDSKRIGINYVPIIPVPVFTHLLPTFFHPKRRRFVISGNWLEIEWARGRGLEVCLWEICKKYHKLTPYCFPVHGKGFYSVWFIQNYYIQIQYRPFSPVFLYLIGEYRHPQNGNNFLNFLFHHNI
jgi:hypothetical protein